MLGLSRFGLQKMMKRLGVKVGDANGVSEKSGRAARVLAGLQRTGSFSRDGGSEFRGDCQRVRFVCFAPRRGCVVPSIVGAVAQLGERLHGMQEVTSSILVSSTAFL